MDAPIRFGTSTFGLVVCQLGGLLVAEAAAQSSSYRERYSGTPIVQTAQAPPPREDGLDGSRMELAQYLDYDEPGWTDRSWHWYLVPDGLLYDSYLAGPKEPRMGAVFLYDTDGRWIFDGSVGGRVGIVRWGTADPISPEGWQLDLEGAVFPRVNLDQDEDLESADFRFGVPLTWSQGPFEAKFEYYHLSSHLGDDFLVRHPMFVPADYSRDALVLGGAWRPILDLRLYAEADWAFDTGQDTKPWQFQFGIDYSQVEPGCCSPFVAANVHLREEVDFGGGVNVIAGWQWRSRDADRLLRLGAQYYNGKSYQFSFFDEHEELVGAGLWYDF